MSTSPDRKGDELIWFLGEPERTTEESQGAVDLELSLAQCAPVPSGAAFSWSRPFGTGAGVLCAP